MELGYQKIDKYDEECVAQMATHYKAILKLLGEDPDREGLRETPFVLHDQQAHPYTLPERT